MDLYSAEGELFNIHNHFHQGQYQKVIDYDTSDLSEKGTLPARILKLRAQISLGEAQKVLDQVKDESSPDLKAVEAFAESSLGHTETAVEAIEKLAASDSKNVTVQILGGTVLQAAGKTDEALELLSQHESSCELTNTGTRALTPLMRSPVEALALIVQIHLQQNRTDLALKEVAAGRKWAQDDLLVNLAESWTGLRVGGEQYQQAFYVFEELAQAPATSSTKSLVSQAICEMHLGSMEEAQGTLEQALSREPQCVDAIANLLVLKTILGQDTEQLLETLKKESPDHTLVADLEEKAALFDKAAAKYTPKVPS